MRKLVLILLLALLTAPSFAMIGLGDWQRDTPYGNYMYDAGGGACFVFKHPYQELIGLDRWYFYHGYTVGQYQKGYFIADEKASELKLFTDQKEWEATLVKLDLIPTWTRWYSDDWHFFDNILVILVFAFYVSIPLLIALGIVFYYAFVREGFNVRKPYTLISLGIIIITVQYYLEMNPASV
jgi:hypothetical protein